MLQQGALLLVLLSFSIMLFWERKGVRVKGRAGVGCVGVVGLGRCVTPQIWWILWESPSAKYALVKVGLMWT
jgi:hypothetical protein